VCADETQKEQKEVQNPRKFVAMDAARKNLDVSVGGRKIK
jgi:hypothetical protein